MHLYADLNVFSPQTGAFNWATIQPSAHMPDIYIFPTFANGLNFNDLGLSDGTLHINLLIWAYNGEILIFAWFCGLNFSKIGAAYF